MGRTQLSFVLLLCIVSLAYADKLYGKCPMAKQIFGTKSSRESTTDASQEQMCPNVQKNCCDDDTYKSMYVWWDDSGEMSMNRIWLKKIDKMMTQMKIQKEVYFPKIKAFLESKEATEFTDIECMMTRRNADMLMKVNAYHQFFENYPLTSQRCWQYTIDFMRGLMCGVCDTASTIYLSEKMFSVDKSQCWSYMEACNGQLKATIVFLNYVKNFAALGSCKLKGIVEDDAQKPYISEQDQEITNLCLQFPRSVYCIQVCEKYMPWTGITLMEQNFFDDIFNLIFQIKHYFPDAEYTVAADQVVDTWETSKDHDLISLLNKQVVIKEDAFNVTDYNSNKAAGLSLTRLGFVDLKEYMLKESKIHYYAALLSISWIAGLIAMATLN